MSWQAVAEQAVRARSEAVLERMRAAIAEHLPGVEVTSAGDAVRVRGRGLKRRWLSEPGLRFARRIMR